MSLPQNNSKNNAPNADKRFFVDGDGSVLIANLKCGFSTLNNALIKNVEEPQHTYADDPKAAVKEAKRVVLFVREPKSRFRSFYRNWIVKNDPSTDKGLESSGYRTCKRWMAPSDFEKLITSSSEERDTREFLAFFLDALGPAVLHNQHSAPQWCILQKYGLSIDDVSEIHDYRKNTELLQETYGIEAKVRNITRSPDDGVDSLATPELDSFCDVIYARDRALFETYYK